MLLELTTQFTENSGRRLFSSNGISAILHEENAMGGVVVDHEKSWSCFTQQPIVLQEDNTLAEARSISSEDLRTLQNELSGVCVRQSEENPSVLIFSTRISRSRMYFLQGRNSLYLSPDLRKLLPFSRKVLDQEIAFGIVKFGDVPEYNTVIRDIKAVPVGCFIDLKSDRLRDVLNGVNLSIADFKPYYQIYYPESGGDVLTTKETLDQILGFMKRYNPGLLVSGGIDSSLLNYLYNEVADDRYPAFFLDFEEAPEERTRVLQSLKNTRGELVIIPVTDRDSISRFQHSVEKLIYPVYDNGSALAGEIFSETLRSQCSSPVALIDGTLADSCYGVRDYRYPLAAGGEQSESYSLLKEWMYSKIELGGIGHKRTRPRDSYLHDEFLQDLLWYGGVYANLWFKNARSFTVSLREKYYWYLNLLDDRYRDQYWPRYTILKMLLYAGKQTTVKSFDMLLPNQVYFPFMFKTVLDDQGKYTWHQKSENGIVKAPLKTLMQKYASTDFIYRKKSGLQSQTRQWINRQPFKQYISELLFVTDSIADEMMGRHAAALKRVFQRENPPETVLSVALSLAVLQYWIAFHGISIKDEPSVSR